ncbi:MAG: TetR family transcriptional regulator [Solirubrobacterales bacterium]|nr:TetR family transcriptional regulator [Solirubrobacterales bacterium]
MGRWEPDSRGRLAQAALELFAERGFENTTVAEIAERAGLTERTFFRHYADKREVLFPTGGEFENLIVTAIESAPAALAPIDAVGLGLDAAAAMLEQRGEFSRRRQAIITANAELRERELIKLASLSDAIADTLRGRGVTDPGASLTAEVAIAVFRVAFARWHDEAGGEDLRQIMRSSLDELKAQMGAPSSAPAGQAGEPANAVTQV